jgi:hypothetical protein
MKVTKRQLKRIIKEEKRKLLREQWGSRLDTGSDIIEFAKAYVSLGNAAQEQVDAVVSAYNNSGGADSEDFMEAVYEQNPNAISMAYDKLGRILGMMEDDDAIGIQEALQAAMEIYEQGDDEVEADAAAARNR